LNSAEAQKPFGLLGEGVLQKNSRGDKTAIELFLGGIRGWEADLRRRVQCENSIQE
jgi:hypothetical protein